MSVVCRSALLFLLIAVGLASVVIIDDPNSFAIERQQLAESLSRTALRELEAGQLTRASIRIFLAERFCDNHSQVNWAKGALLRARGQHTAALPYLNDALALSESRSPPIELICDIANSHFEIASSIDVASEESHEVGKRGHHTMMMEIIISLSDGSNDECIVDNRALSLCLLGALDTIDHCKAQVLLDPNF